MLKLKYTEVTILQRINRSRSQFYLYRTTHSPGNPISNGHRLYQKLDHSRTVVYQVSESLDARTFKKVEDKESVLRKTQQLADQAVSYILPKGYPHSVRNGYSTFIKGQITSNTLSTAAGVLSMQSLLYAMSIGMGVGSGGMDSAGGSLALAATLNWVIKDGLGQLGGVVFASFVSNRFDADPKRWRLLATLSMDLASFIELLTPLAPAYFLLIASVANIGKNVSFLAASASRAAIHKSFALQENLADVTAKTGSQSIMSSLAGTSLGVGISAGLGSAAAASGWDPYCATVGAYCALSSVSIAATYWSLTHVTITSLSRGRLDYLLWRHFEESALLHPLHSSVPVPVPLVLSSLSLSSSDSAATVRSMAASIRHERALISPEGLRLVESLLGAPALPLTGTGAGACGLTLPPLHVGADLSIAFSAGPAQFEVIC
jgi:hypothetical protein